MTHVSNAQLISGATTGERAQSMVLVVLFMTVLLGMAGLAIDAASWYVKRHEAQAAADFAATAGAAKLSQSSALAVSTANSYVQQNLAGATATVTPGYQGDATKIKVQVDVNAPTFFTKLFGIDQVAIKASSAARAGQAATRGLIYAHDSSCGEGRGLNINANAMIFDGAVVSNGFFHLDGNNITSQGAYGGGPNRCNPLISGSNLDLPGNQITREDFAHTWPAYYTQADFTCTFSAANFTWSSTNVTIPNGTYCATNRITLTGNNLRCDACTFIAARYVINGNHFTFSPHTNDVVFYQTGNTLFELNGNNYAINGTVFAPNAKLLINGNALSSFNGLFEGNQVEINGNAVRMTGNGPNVGSGGSTEMFE